MLDDSGEDVDLINESARPVAGAVVVQHANRRIPHQGRQDFLIDVSRSELHAAAAMMEFRERWWTEGFA